MADSLFNQAFSQSLLRNQSANSRAVDQALVTNHGERFVVSGLQWKKKTLSRAGRDVAQQIDIKRQFISKAQGQYIKKLLLKCFNLCELIVNYSLG